MPLTNLTIMMLTHYFIYFLFLLGVWIFVMELYPGFSLYRGLYEFAQYSFNGNYMGTNGMKWRDLSDSRNGMKDVLIIMVVEWVLVILVAYYYDRVVSSGTGFRRSPLFFLPKKLLKKGFSSSFRKPSFRRQTSKVYVQMEKADVTQEVNLFFHFS